MLVWLVCMADRFDLEACIGSSVALRDKMVLDWIGEKYVARVLVF